MKRLVVAVVVTALSAAAGVACGVQQSPAEPDSSSRILFWSSRGGGFGVYSMSVDGTDTANLSTGEFFAAAPSWSPDGRQLAFTCWQGEQRTDICLVNADGSDVVRLTQSETQDEYSPRWSPDGQRLLFTSFRDGEFQVHVINADGSECEQVTDSQGEVVFGGDWSPSGEYILFVSSGARPAEIHSMRSDGSEVRQLTDNEFNEAEPRWSPDEKTIAYVRYKEQRGQVWLMDADGSDARPITPDDLDALGPVWSPNGERVAFTVRLGGKGDPSLNEIFVVDADGSNPTQLTDNNVSDAVSDWR